MTGGIPRGMTYFGIDAGSTSPPGRVGWAYADDKLIVRKLRNTVSIMQVIINFFLDIIRFPPVIFITDTSKQMNVPLGHHLLFMKIE